MEVDIEKAPQDITNTKRREAKGIKDKLDLKERLINLKVDLIQVHSMPIHGCVILPVVNKPYHTFYWRNFQFPYLIKFHDTNFGHIFVLWRRWHAYIVYFLRT